jgi:hypothetical protein
VAERALKLLDEETGSAFDASCVAALRAVVGEDPGFQATFAAPVQAIPRPGVPKTV